MSIPSTRLAQAVARFRPSVGLCTRSIQSRVPVTRLTQIRSIQEWQQKGSRATPPSSKENPTHGIAPGRDEVIGGKSFADFDLNGRVCIVTGGAQGLGLALAEGLCEAGANGKQVPLSLHRIEPPPPFLSS